MELTETKTTRPLMFIGIGLLMLFVLLAALVKTHSSTFPIDIWMQSHIDAIRTHALTVFFLHMCELASVNGVLLFALATGVALGRGRERLSALLIGWTLLTGAVGIVCKNIVDRARPDHALALVFEKSFSFPSGHTLAAASCWGIASYLLIRSIASRHTKAIIVLGYLVLVLLVALGRMYLGAHYLSDVIGSMLLGFGMLALLLAALSAHPNVLPERLFDRRVIWSVCIGAAVTIIVALFLPRLFT